MGPCVVTGRHMVPKSAGAAAVCYTCPVGFLTRSACSRRAWRTNDACFNCQRLLLLLQKHSCCGRRWDCRLLRGSMLRCCSLKPPYPTLPYRLPCGSCFYYHWSSLTGDRAAVRYPLLPVQTRSPIFPITLLRFGVPSGVRRFLILFGIYMLRGITWPTSALPVLLPLL